MKIRYPTVLFDLDGTLLDTLADLRTACNVALASVGAPARCLDEVRQFVGNGIAMLLERAIPGGRQHPRFTEALATLQTYYQQHDRVETMPYPGVVGLLKTLKAEGVRCGVVSNKPDAAVKDLCAAFFPGLLAVSSGELPGMRRKPAPDVVEHALAAMGVNKNGCLYVGDSDVDLATARAAGIPCVSVTWGFRTSEQLLVAGATCLVHVPAEVLDVVHGQRQP